MAFANRSGESARVRDVSPDGPIELTATAGDLVLRRECDQLGTEFQRWTDHCRAASNLVEIDDAFYRRELALRQNWQAQVLSLSEQRAMSRAGLIAKVGAYKLIDGSEPIDAGTLLTLARSIILDIDALEAEASTKADVAPAAEGYRSWRLFSGYAFLFGPSSPRQDGDNTRNGTSF